MLSDQRDAVSVYQGNWRLGGELPVLLEPVSVVEVAFEIDVIVDGRMDGGEFLETSHSPETEHGPLSPSQG